jgi:pimeloyl-ACP methyl ester carboxylesterase
MSTCDVTTVRFIGHGGVPLVGDAWGQGRPVLFLHGGGQTRHAWEKTARAVAKAGWRAITLDLRGHGDSGWAPDKDYTIDAFVGDIREVVERLEHAPVVVGASLGGIMATVAEGESPSFRGLVLVDIAVKAEPAGVARVLGFMAANPDGFASLEEAADAIASYLPHRPRPQSLDGLRKNLRRRDDGRYRWHWDPGFMSRDQRTRAASGQDRLEEAAKNLKLPTLLVRGQRSEILSEEGVRHFRELVPQAKYVDVSGAGHMVAGDENDAFSTAVIDFLASQ